MDEILVHIAAPSTVHDDARYRAQVAAIIDFHASHTHPPQASRPESPRPDSLESLISVIPDSQDLQCDPDPKQEQKHAHTHTHTHTHTQHTPCAVDCLQLPWEIHPPKPPVSSATFETHVTATLAMLTERLKPARTYSPVFQRRLLDPLERGYWFVRFEITDTDQAPDREREAIANITSPGWPAPLFGAFWSFLSEFVGRDGRAGWGVWCVLERDSVSPSNRVTLKLYTWGEIAMHIYLLLFLASERRIRGMGAQWIDSREEVVVQMS